MTARALVYRITEKYEPVTVEQFASELKLPVDLLLDQLKNAGVKKITIDELSEDDKAASSF